MEPVPMTCANCGQSFKAEYKFRNKARFCSRECSGRANGRASAASKCTVPREKLAEIIARELPDYQGTFGHGLGNMAEHIARATGRNSASVERLLNRILNNTGEFTLDAKRMPGNVTLWVADDILAGLGLTHLWHTELADIYEEEGGLAA